MCRGFKQNEGQLLRIKEFHAHLSAPPRAATAASLPDFLTLHYLPRINGALLEINGSYIRPDSPAFVTLHRVLSSSGGGFSYASREKVVACEGARFEIYVGDAKLLKGIFRRDGGGGDERESNWKMDCKCALSVDDVVIEGMKAAEVSVTVAGDGPAVVVTEKVEMAAALRRRRRRRRGGCCELEEIPEEREAEIGSDVCWCCDCGGGVEEEMDGGDGGVEVEVEAVRWALDVGIWVVCIGVGYLVTKASSSNRLRRKRFI
ncbi:hypothetical protein ACP275_05G066400 [Erythranthe tilingii]